jgi:nucleoid DNA-binding protein
MTRLKIAQTIWEELEAQGKSHITAKEINQILRKFLQKIEKAVVEGNRVELRGFGVFSPIVRHAKIGRNPRRPEIDIEIPERKAMKFLQSSLLSRKLNDH